MQSQQSTSSLTEKLTLFFMIAAIFATVLWGLESWFETRINSCQNDLQTRRRQHTETIAAATEPELFITRTILPVLRQVSENPQIDLEKLRAHHLQKNRLDMTLYQFDARGELTRTAPARAPNLWLMRNLFTSLRETDIRKVSQARKGLDKKLEFAFGFGKDLNSIRENPETIINTASGDKEGMLAWTSRPNGGLIITCSEAPEARRIFRLRPEVPASDPTLAQTGILETVNNGSSLAGQAYSFLSRLGVDSGFYAGRHWFFINTRSARRVFAAFRTVPCPFTRALHLIRLVIASTALAVLLFFAIAGTSMAISLKKLVITMFFASSLIPLSGIASTTLDNLDVFTQIHNNKTRAAKEETLSNMVQNFNKYLASSSASLVRLTENPGTGSKDPATQQMNSAITAAFPEARITLRNSAGDLIFSNSPDFSSGRETVFKSLSRRLVERYIPERLDEHRYNGNPFSDSMVRKDDMGFGTLLNYPNRLQFVRTGNSEMLLFYRLLPASKGSAAIAQVELSTSATVRRYLKAVGHQPVSVENNSMTISAFYPKGYRWSLPPSTQHQKAVLQIAEAAHVTGKAQFRRLTGNIDGFALCIPASELAGNCLIAFSSAQPLDEALARMKNRILSGTVIALILLISLATWISRQLISPLDNLESGIKALAARNFEARISVPPGKDELSQLFHAFNDMMAESYDMQIAHSVQEGLVPSEFPEVAGYNVFGMLQSASDLGGDCLDCFLLPNGHLLFLVGDLTGHGVGSALMMAFARAVTFHWSQKGNLTPASLVDQIDNMLRENRTERMFMGIICGVLNPENHEVELVTKGHIYPLKVSTDGTCTWKGLPAYPLGIARQTSATSIRFTMNPGDGLLCMTDGFLEAYNRQLRTIGFDGIEEWAVATASSDARGWVQALETRFKIWCDNRQSDDISIFALKRQSEADKHVS